MPEDNNSSQPSFDLGGSASRAHFEFIALPLPNGARPLPLADPRAPIDHCCKNPAQYHWRCTTEKSDLLLIAAPLNPADGQPVLEEAVQEELNITDENEMGMGGCEARSAMTVEDERS